MNDARAAGAPLTDAQMTDAQVLRDRIVREIDALGFGAHGLHVRIGDNTAQHRWVDDVREDIHSVAKGVCVLAAAFAAEEGLIAFDEPVAHVLPQAEFGEGSSTITLRHLLSMTSGIDLPWSPTMMSDWPDLAFEFLGRASRGRAFQYSNASTYTAMRMLAARVGDVAEYVDRKLFAALGIENAQWDRCPNGYIVAGGGLWLRTEEMARIGRFVRDAGRWGGRQLLSPEWIAAMHSDWVPTGGGPAYERYALGGWDGPGPAWRFHGAYGQLVIFTGAAVVTITASDHEGADRIAAFIAQQ